MIYLRNEEGFRIQVGIFQSDINEYIPRYRTMCCALGQLSLSNSTSLESIKEIIELIKSEDNVIVDRMNRVGGERAIFVITTPDESILENNLELAGFKMIYEFHSRNYNPEDRMLKMWIISW